VTLVLLLRVLRAGADRAERDLVVTAYVAHAAARRARSEAS